MTSGIFNGIWLRFRCIAWQTSYSRLITINCLVFIFLTLGNLIYNVCKAGTPAWFTTWLAMPGDLNLFLQRPWTIVTYMFVNTDLLRLVFNMLWLLCFGRLLSLPLSGGRIVLLYITGGVAGAAVYLIGSAAGWWTASWLIGPSASIIAVTVAVAMLLPKLDVNLLIIGNVKVIWVASCVLLIYFLDIDGLNVGGNGAHAGGALGGLLFVICRNFHWSDIRLRKSIKTNNYKDFRGRNRFGQKSDEKKIDPQDNARLDRILDKVKRAGYGALSSEEKAELFDISRRIK